MTKDSIYLNVMGLACLCVTYPMVKFADYCDCTSGNIAANIRYDLCKLIIDRVGGVVLLFVLSPLLAMISLSIMVESPGGALFRQNRYGKNSRIFSILKFRTMRSDAADGILATAGDPQSNKSRAHSSHIKLGRASATVERDRRRHEHRRSSSACSVGDGGRGVVSGSTSSLLQSLSIREARHHGTSADQGVAGPNRYGRSTGGTRAL